MILLYLIETNDTIKALITEHVSNLGTSIASHERNCQGNVTNLTEHINKLSTNIKMQKKDVTKQEEDTNRLRNKFDIIQNWAMEKLLKDSLEDTQKANPNLVKKGSYILTDEGEETLPKDLKKMIENMVLEVKMESPEDALDLLAKIGRDELKEFAKQSNLQFKEIVALSILYATKMSEWSK
jgi:ribosomal protein S15P/S13E